MKVKKAISETFKKILYLMDINYQEKNYLRYFNTPIKFYDDEWYVNERIVELPFVLTNIELLNGAHKKNILDFGCTKSYLSIQLASIGHNVVGIDLRDYKFKHPNFTFNQKNILDWESKTTFDYIVAISVLEHVGLGAFGEEENNEEYQKVTKKLQDLLTSSGKIIITVPFGKKHKDNFERSFNYKEIKQMFNKLELTLERFYLREDLKFWRQCTLEDAQKISNEKTERGPTGVNCVGCFVWEKGER